MAQTIRQSQLSCDISNRNPCTSKDLDVVSIFIDAPACVTCNGSGSVTFPLKMTIHNGTKSERTSFSLYGTLSNGAKITHNGTDYTGNIFICVGPITVKSDETLPGETAPGNQTFAVGSITFNCGQELSLTNNFLAWTDASGSTVPRCEEYAKATKCSDIAPKCGFAAAITIQGPVPAPTCGKVDPTCTVSTGKITVTSSTTGYTFSLDGAAFEAYPTGGWTVQPGSHNVRAKRTSDGCISPETPVTIAGAPATPDAPTLGKVDPTCTVSTGKVTITSTTTDLTFSLDNAAFESYPTGGWTVQPGEHCVRAKNSDGCISTAACITIPAQPPTPDAPTLGKVDPTCTVSTGKVTITSTTTDLTFSLDNAAFEAYPTGGWTVQPGEHCVRAKNSDGCISTAACITISRSLVTPDRPVVTIQEATLCGSLTAPTVTVSCPIAGTYTLTQTGVAGSQTKTYPATNPVVFTVQAGKQFSITVTNTDGCTSAATDCNNYLTNSCPAPPSVTKVAEQTVELAAPKTNVLAAPNPFTNRVRFTMTSAVSGMGSLEIYNTMGQKIATVYQGYVEAGKPLNKEYVAQRALRANLIYVFRVGDQKTSGKLLNW